MRMLLFGLLTTPFTTQLLVADEDDRLASEYGRPEKLAKLADDRIHEASGIGPVSLPPRDVLGSQRLRRQATPVSNRPGG